MTETVAERLAIKSRQVRPGTAQAISVASGQLVQIVDMQGKQVARMVAFVPGDAAEYLSVATSRTLNHNLMVQKGQRLYSNRGTALLELTEDAVGRHDTLLVPEPAPTPAVAEADDLSLPAALASAGVRAVIVPASVNWFQNVGIQQRGELAVRLPLSEAGDAVELTALVDLVIGIEVPAGDGGDILIRLYAEPRAETSVPDTEDRAAASTATPEAAAVVVDTQMDAVPGAPDGSDDAAAARSSEGSSATDEMPTGTNSPDLPLEAAAAIAPARLEPSSAATGDEETAPQADAAGEPR